MELLCSIQFVIVEGVPEDGVYVVVGIDNPAGVEPFVDQIERCVVAHGLPGLFLKESEEFLVCLWCHGGGGFVYAAIDVGAVVAVLYAGRDDSCQAGFQRGIVEGAVAAVGGEIGVVVGEDGLGLAGVVGEAGLGIVARRRCVGHGGWDTGWRGVGGGEVALAVPSVAWAVVVPEGVVDG